MPTARLCSELPFVPYRNGIIKLNIYFQEYNYRTISESAATTVSATSPPQWPAPGRSLRSSTREHPRGEGLGREELGALLQHTGWSVGADEGPGSAASAHSPLLPADRLAAVEPGRPVRVLDGGLRAVPHRVWGNHHRLAVDHHH